MIPRPRPWLAALAAALLALLLAWHDVLPGGWTLRGLFVDRAARAAREQAERSAARLAEFAAASQAPGAVVFLGSSTIERWPLGVTFPGSPTADRGISNEPAADLLARIEASLPPEPAGLVVYAASVDFRAGAAPEELERRVQTVMQRLAELAPGVPLVLLGILPERGMAPADVERLRRANARLEQLAVRRGAAWVPTARPPLADAAGALTADYSVDRLHLSPAGYAVLAQWLLAEGGEVGRYLAP